MKSNKTMNGVLLAIIGVAIAALSVVLCYVVTKPDTGSMRLRVLDAYTAEPIEGASIVFPISGDILTSDASGFALAVNIPCEYDDITPEYGTTLILASADGYMPFALFYAIVYPDTVREGPTLYLFPENHEYGTDIITMIESPDRDWVTKLLQTYIID